MRQDIQVLDRVKSAYASLRPSEQRVADYVLGDPEGAALSSLPLLEQPANRPTHRVSESSMASVFFMMFHSPIHFGICSVFLGTVPSIPKFCKVVFRLFVKSL